MSTAPVLLPTVLHRWSAETPSRWRADTPIQLVERGHARRTYRTLVQPRRRRLRREVRLAGTGVLGACTLLGLVWGSTAVLNRSEPARLPFDAVRIEGIDAAPSHLVSLSIAPAARDRRSEMRSIRVRPAGYLLPVDGGREESAHGDP